MADTFIISGLREKRSAVAGQIVELRRQLDRLQADLFHIDAVLRLYDVEPSEIPTKGRVPVRSAYFGRNEITRRIYDALRERGAVKAVDIAAQAMRDKGLIRKPIGSCASTSRSASLRRCMTYGRTGL
jgi:hypothetical protein